MDYLYENLGDERFQEFCSCLISKEFPNIQAFPVGQPDGGRDSIVFQMNSTIKEFIVFQVKFVRNPNEDRDIHKWLTSTIEGEVEKIDKLIPKGAIRYYLLTNVRGTAHLDKGSKDKVNRILEENIKIPSICWWRDDLSIMFEKDPLFKWSFPAILNGQDVLNAVLFESLNENKERRESVIKAYLVDQYEADNEVKFKQIDLQNRLLNLFTDVPIRVKKYNEKNKALRYTLGSLDYQRRIPVNDDNLYLEDRNDVGAAEFLLHPKVQSEIERILLEGGPGQGKSTIAQYICQVHRARLLNKSSDIDLLPKNIKNTPVRLPIKIDLRDISNWVEKKNPYQGILSQEYFENIWKNSLESFIVGHIFYHSKLEEFTSSDFIAICKLSPMLFVFDGFDEIANLKVRGEVIDFINKGINRLSGNIKSIQVLITSRPAAFSVTVGFSIDNYPHFELTDITLPIINDYVEKWIKASKLDTRDANELRKLIKDKLEMPHLKDLAKSPMQLAIFISLLRTKGQSLPNKRTALYDSYIELFFDRESEKNKLIRDKRDLIIAIHQYLAWVLHSEAELYKNNGSIHIADLNLRLKEYFEKEGHDTSIADQLFDVMKERVCALVSRVQGTFEFEVQPLREYFCAKHLYKSAPHSSAGSVKNGTKPDRLHAILRNFYWQNVVRFFAGCADAGELDMIIQELKELQTDELLKYTNYPRIITSQILSDYVFSQKPLKLKDVVQIIVDGINIGNIIDQDRRFASNEPLLLPNECGRVELIKECFSQLSKFPNSDYSYDLIGIINNNPLNNSENWLEFLPLIKGEQLTTWLEYAYKMQLIYKIDEDILYRILNEGDIIQTKKRIQILLNGNRLEVIDKDIDLKNILYSGILNNELSVFRRNNPVHSLNFLTLILHPYILSSFLSNEEMNATFINYFNHFIDRHSKTKNTSKLITEFIVSDDIDRTIQALSNSLNSLFNYPIANFKNNIEPWDILVENCREVLKDNWSLNIVATIAAGIKSKDETYDEYNELNNSSLSLCKRTRCARMKSGNVKYWELQFSETSNNLFTLLVFFTWATPKVIVQLLPLISQILKSLDSEKLTLLSNALSSTTNNSTFEKSQHIYIITEIENKEIEDILKYILSLRFNEENRHKFIYNHISNFSGILEEAKKIKFQYLLGAFFKDPTNTAILFEIKKAYKETSQYDERRYYSYRMSEPINLPYGIAQTIMKECKEYPIVISSLAEKTCRLYANEKFKAVGETAKNEKWFEGN